MNPETYSQTVPLRLVIASLKGRILLLRNANPGHPRIRRLERRVAREQERLRQLLEPRLIP